MHINSSARNNSYAKNHVNRKIFNKNQRRNTLARSIICAPNAGLPTLTDHLIFHRYSKLTVKFSE